jgi:outer membrane protein assembly factor BamE (lipoprotein component of BamABCDE complex)
MLGRGEFAFDETAGYVIAPAEGKRELGMVVFSGLRARCRPPGGTARRALLALIAATLLTGCFFTETRQRGYVLPEGALEQVPLGASQEQVLIVLGTPSTVATLSGDVFYYISQRTERTAFLPQQETDRRVIAVYFDRNRRVRRLADYGLKDGEIFDFISRTTPTSGTEISALNTLFRNIFRR